MYGQSYAVRARDTYRALDLTSRLEGANAHSLVTILYDELIGGLGVLSVAMRTQNAALCASNATRIRAILITLRAGLDFEAGGDLAVTLEGIYAAMVRLLDQAVREGSAEQIDELQTHITSIATAWKQIAA
jgi:flagellar secretion chaperone FliS